MKKKIMNLLFLLFPLRKRILFESNPEFSCNSKPVYDELIKRNIQKKYEMVWLVEDKKKYRHSGIKAINYPTTIIDKAILQYFKMTSSVIIFTNRIMQKEKKKQLVVNLMHGMPLKSPGNYKQNDTCDFMISSGKALHHQISLDNNFPEERIISLGYPRTDVLNKSTNAKKKLNLLAFNKVIVWMPTFRKNKNSNLNLHMDYRSGVPLLENDLLFVELNKHLVQLNEVLIIKLHPAADVRGMQLESYSHIKFYSDTYLKDVGTNTYSLLAECDALITDYSSVYYDFVITKKPIGLVIDDIDEYIDRNGLTVDYFEVVKGFYIKTYNDLISFFDNISNGIDKEFADRCETMDKYCDYTDFNSSARVVDFILSEIEKREKM